MNLESSTFENVAWPTVDERADRSRNDNERTIHETIVHSGSVFLPVLRRISLAILCIWTTMAIFSSMGKAASLRRRARFARKSRSASSFESALGLLKSELH